MSKVDKGAALNLMLLPYMGLSVALVLVNTLWVFTVASGYLLVLTVLVNTVFSEIRPTGKTISLGKNGKLQIIHGAQIIIAILAGYWLYVLLGSKNEPYLSYYLLLVLVFALSTVRITYARVS